MKTIAITGGIGSGKSTVTEYLSGKGYTIIDADRMARDMTAPGGKAMPYILENFGPAYVEPDGSLNRSAMRDLVFRDSKAKSLLESGTTRVVLEDIEKIKKECEQSGTSVLFFDIPLLFETHQESNYDIVWVVTADHDIRVQRIMQRDSIDRTIAELMISSQAEEEYKTSRADSVLSNNTTIQDLHNQIDDLLEKVF